MTTLDPRAVTRPIIGIENRTAQEVFDIMSDRILAALSQPQAGEPVGWQRKHPEHGWIDVGDEYRAHYERMGQEIRPLYASPQPANLAQGVTTDFLRGKIGEIICLETGADENSKGLAQAVERILAAIGAGGQAVKPQHVAYFDDGQFHWMSGIAPRNCELYTHPVPSGRAVAVKPLEWRGTTSNSICGQYHIELQGASFALWITGPRQCLGMFDTADATKAAAQADYERRILSALSSAPTADGWRTMEDAPKDRTRTILAWTKPENLPPHIELGYWSDGKASWVNTYGNSFSGEPDLWFLPPLPAAPTGGR